MKHTFLQSPSKQRAALPVIAVFTQHATDHPFIATLNSQDRRYVRDALKNFSGAFLECELLHLPSHHTSTVLLFGLGEKKNWTHRHTMIAVRKIVQFAKSVKKKSCALLINDIKIRECTDEACAEMIAQNCEMAQYVFNDYLEKPKDGWLVFEEMQYCIRGVSAGSLMQKALERGKIIGEQVNAARDLSNVPGGDMTPKRLSHHAKEQGKKHGLSVEVLGEKQMEQLGMGAILGVSRGSVEEAQFIIMEYYGTAKNKKPIVFVGKGITFDSGGLNLKPTGSLEEMHMDMSGGAAVLSAIVAIARLKVRTNIIGIIPAVENMPSGSSYRPGDILRSMSGKSIEIVNTDAEGRVVLADALTYAKRYEPRMVVDIATLTGACMVALGSHAAGVFSRNEKLLSRLTALGEKSGDYLWPLPMWDEYADELKGTIADIRNAKKSRDAGATNGALFLYQFAQDFQQWAHIDIASTMTTVPAQCLSAGSRGAGTALLIELARADTEPTNS